MNKLKEARILVIYILFISFFNLSITAYPNLFNEFLYRRVRNTSEINVHFINIPGVTPPRFEEELGVLWKSLYLEKIKSKLMKEGVREIYVLLGTDFPHEEPTVGFAFKVYWTKEDPEYGLFKEKFNMDFPLDANVIGLGSRFPANSWEDKLMIIEHELFHIYFKARGGIRYEIEELTLRAKLNNFTSEESKAVLNLLGPYHHIGENNLIRLQIREGFMDSARKRSEYALREFRDEISSGKLEASDKAWIYGIFIFRYLNSGIIGFEMEGETEFANYLEKELKYLYSKYLSPAEMDRAINEFIRRYETLFTNDIFYVPKAEDVELVFKYRLK